MPINLIVEDGSMPPGANSYAEVATCDQWQGDRGGSTWPAPPSAGDDPDLEKKKSSLIQATDYLNTLDWVGSKAAPGRVMAWPRVGVIDEDSYPISKNEVPLGVVDATCYLAGLVYGGTNLFPVLERGGRIEEEQVGSLRTKFFDDASNQNVFPMLKGYLSGLAVNLDGSGTAGKMTISKVSLA